MKKFLVRITIASVLIVTALSTSAMASRYGDCYESCLEKQGKRWQPATVAGACSKGCSFRHDQSNSEQTNHKRAIQQCVDKYGSSNSLYWACKGAVDSF